MERVRAKTGAPVESDFIDHRGTPIVVDTTTTTGRAYFIDDGDNIREVGDYGTDKHVTGTLTVDTLIDNVGGQIAFPATQVPSADANTLDDYEEGATTPAVTAAIGTFTSVSCALKYTKIGNRVSWNAAVTITENGTAGGYVIVPLPFTPAENTAATGYNETTGAVLAVAHSNASAAAFILTAAGGYPGADSTVLLVAGQFRV